MITNGMKVKDKISGFEGIVTGRCEYITGCTQILVQPQAKDKTKPEPQWLDEQRLQVDKKFKPIVLDNSMTPGFDAAAPKR